MLKIRNELVEVRCQLESNSIDVNDRLGLLKREGVLEEKLLHQVQGELYYHGRLCWHCGKPLPRNAHPNQKYCSQQENDSCYRDRIRITDYIRQQKYRERWSKTSRTLLKKPELGGKGNLKSPHPDDDIITEAKKVHNELNRIARHRRNREFINFSNISVN